MLADFELDGKQMNHLKNFLVLFSFMALSSMANVDRNDNEIAQKISTVKGKIFARYNSLLKENARLDGLLNVVIHISGDGTVKVCNTDKSTIPSNELRKQVCDIFDKLNFGVANQNEYIYEYKMDFFAK